MIQGATTEGELIAATAALTRLLMTHNLELAELDEITGKLTKKSKIANVMGTTETKALWKRELIHAIADNYFCHIVWYVKSMPRFLMFGTRENLEVSRELFLQTSGIIEHLGEMGYISYMKACMANNVREVLHGREWKTSFYQGAVAGFREAFRDTAAIVETEVPNGSAIAVLLKEESEAAGKEYFDDIKTTKVAKVSLSQEAYKAGKKAGRNLETKVVKKLQTV